MILQTHNHKTRNLQRWSLLSVKKNDQTSSSLNLPAEQIRSNSSPPAAYSITMARWVGVKTTYKSKKTPQISPLKIIMIESKLILHTQTKPIYIHIYIYIYIYLSTIIILSYSGHRHTAEACKFLR